MRHKFYVKMAIWVHFYANFLQSFLLRVHKNTPGVTSLQFTTLKWSRCQYYKTGLLNFKKLILAWLKRTVTIN